MFVLKSTFNKMMKVNDDIIKQRNKVIDNYFNKILNQNEVIDSLSEQVDDITEQLAQSVKENTDLRAELETNNNEAAKIIQDLMLEMQEHIFDSLSFQAQNETLQNRVRDLEFLVKRISRG